MSSYNNFLLAELLPSVGVKMYNPTTDFCNGSHMWEYYTNPVGRRAYMCQECGTPFISRSKTNPRYCGHVCASRAQQRRLRENRYKLIYKLVDKKAFANWFKLNNNKVIGYIYNNFDSEYREQLIDDWTDKSMYWYYKIRNKDNPWGFIKTALNYYFIKYKYNKKEIFYSECNYKTQEKILGAYEDLK